MSTRNELSPEQEEYTRNTFKTKIYELCGQAFQNFFVDIMTRLHKDFRPIKAEGKIGDEGNDGYARDRGVYFQVYAPEDPKTKVKEAARKAERDLARVVSRWKNVQEYRFVFNDKYQGGGPTIEHTLEDSKRNYKLRVCEPYLAKDLEADFWKLSIPDMNAVLQSRIPRHENLTGLVLVPPNDGLELAELKLFGKYAYESLDDSIPIEFYRVVNTAKEQARSVVLQLKSIRNFDLDEASLLRVSIFRLVSFLLWRRDDGNKTNFLSDDDFASWCFNSLYKDFVDGSLLRTRLERMNYELAEDFHADFSFLTHYGEFKALTTSFFGDHGAIKTLKSLFTYSRQRATESKERTEKNEWLRFAGNAARCLSCIYTHADLFSRDNPEVSSRHLEQAREAVETAGRLYGEIQDSVTDEFNYYVPLRALLIDFVEGHDPKDLIKSLEGVIAENGEKFATNHRRAAAIASTLRRLFYRKLDKPKLLPSDIDLTVKTSEIQAECRNCILTTFCIAGRNGIVDDQKLVLPDPMLGE